MDATAQWADSLLGLERLLFLKLALWAAGSLVVASLLLAVRASRAHMAPMLEGLAVSLIVIGAPLLVVALLGRNGAGLRDLGSATTLDRGLWFVAGFAIGVGTLAAVWAIQSQVTRSRAVRDDDAARPRGSSFGRDAGRAIGVCLHSLALATFALQLARAIVR